jgi:ELWxxDGT repeat protein
MRSNNNITMHLLTPVFVAAAAAIAPAPAQLVVDLNTRLVTRDSEPRVMCQHAGVTYMVANDQTHGIELWRTDGTTAGTFMLADVEPGSGGGGGFCIGGAPNGVLFLEMHNQATGRELWRSDGTAAGTFMLRDIAPGQQSGLGSAVGMIQGSSLLVFLGIPDVAERQLWVSDGTVAGTQMMMDLNEASTGFGEFSIGPTLYFGTYTAADEAQLWSTDGTVAGTQPIRQFNTGGSGIVPYGFVSLGSRAVFRFGDANTEQLWSTDGTNPGTFQLTNFPSGSSIGFTAKAGTTGMIAVVNAPARQLWGTDGLTAEIIDGPTNDLASTFSALHILPNRVVFGAETPATGDELWTTDGTDAGTQLLADFTPGVGGSSFTEPFDSGDLHFFAVGDTFYATDGTPGGTREINLPANANKIPMDGATDATRSFFLTVDTSDFNVNDRQFQLWRYDRAANQATLVKQMTSRFSEIDAMIAGRALFWFDDPDVGIELWMSDGTVAGTTVLRDIATQIRTQTGVTRIFASVDGLALFAGTDDVSQGFTLWRTDGTAAGTVNVSRDVQPASRNVATLSGNRVLFGGASAATGVELWVTNGTAAGTSFLRDINPGAPSSSPGSCAGPEMVVLNGFAYFAADDGTSGIELWRSDGTANGTQRVMDVEAGASSSGPCNFAVFNGHVYFAATSAGDTELWRTDGTAAGTVQVANIHPTGSSLPRALLVYQNALYFAAVGPDTLYYLYRSDGTAAGTTQVPGSPGTNFFGVNPLIVVGNFLYYGLCTNTCGLWRTDGTATGHLALGPGAIGAPFPSRTYGAVGGKLVFANHEAATGVELWETDGTTAGTRLLKEINTNLGGSSFPFDFFDFNGVLYFRANETSELQQALWRTDGTAAGTVRVTSASPGFFMRTPVIVLSGWDAVVAGNRLIYSADDGLTSPELWAHENLAPVASADSVSTNAGAAVTINVTSNDSDEDGAITTSTLRVVTAPANGTVTFDTTAGTARYTPNAGFSGTDQFTYAVADNQRREAAAATVSVTVAAAPTPPPANNGGGGGGGGGSLGLTAVLGLMLLLLTSTSLRAAGLRGARTLACYA